MPANIFRRRVLACCATVFSLLGLLTSKSGKMHGAVDSPYEISLSKNVMITMRDGVQLATDVYRPARNGVPVHGKFPAIMERGPYNKDGGVTISTAHTAPLSAAFFVPHGYVVVLQDVRGRYGSGGHWRAIQDDPPDGFDTAKWIGALNLVKRRHWHHRNLLCWSYSACTRDRGRSFCQGDDPCRRYVGFRPLWRTAQWRF